MIDELTLTDVREYFPEFDIEYHLDTGGQKAVFKGKYEQEDVVVKILPVETQMRDERGEREVEAMQRVDDPGLVELKDHFYREINGQEVLVFLEEWLDGKTLRECISQGDYGPKQGKTVAVSLLQLLEKFDREEVVHRDIKPSNIIIQDGWEVKLLDVGVARILDESTLTPSIAATAPGTPNYMAPEQLENKRDLQDVRTDIFSTGIVFFETVTGQHPFSHPDLKIPNAILQGKRLDLEHTDLSSDIGRKFNEVYMNMTEHQPFQRYRKPRFAVDDLNEIEL